ncbi:shikimate dehydrogenase [Paenarthrobacter sp. NPDC090522]|uniref:shikimate dehydrogenase n=1 Tax=Paenarthrobacter sp. NPDC090522 TaxID=3364383 RepID=UPI0037F81D33
MAEKNSYLVGLIGTGVGQSLSPSMHMTEAAAQGFPLVFKPIDLTALELDPEELPRILDWAEKLGYDAVTVTHPCKQQVVGLLDIVDPVAADLGAVNTVLFTPEGRVGYNTDTSGFEAAFKVGMSGAPVRRVVQLGAGGGGTAVADALVRLGVEELTLVDIDDNRAAALAVSLRERRGVKVHPAPMSELPALLATADGVVHCTPQGMHDHPGTPFDTAYLRQDLWVADIVYRPLETALLKAAREAGSQTLSGGLMAVYQAADAFRLITGVEPDGERMMHHFRELASAEEAAVS